MTEPTTDELLAWFDKWAPSPQGEAHKAIRAILEGERTNQDAVVDYAKGLVRQVECSVVRAFVERVTVKYAQDKRYADIQAYLHLMLAELAAMEREQ